MNIAFAGFRHGHINSLYKIASESENINLTGCFERDENAKCEAKEKLNAEFNYESYEEILNDEQVDAIAIGDYYGIRGKMIISALKAGKHVVCDKPLCTDLKELEEIEKLSEENNLKVWCMLDLRYMAQAEKAKQLIKEGEIGKIHIVSFTGQHPLMYGARPAWYFEEGKHGGTINDIAIHGIDLVRYITGENLSKINFVREWNAFADKEPQFKDCAQFNILMGDMTVSADVSYSAPSFGLPTYWDFYFWGSLGMINFKLSENKIYLYKNEKTEIECPEIPITHLSDFMKEVNGEDTLMKTSDILKSQKQTLIIQNYSLLCSGD